MKVIQSDGGPLICIHHDNVNLWAGIDSKSFIGEQIVDNNDYEAACKASNGVGKISTIYGDAVVIASPYKTALLIFGTEIIYLAQVIYANPEWKFENISLKDFEKILFPEADSVQFQAQAGTYVIFDAALPGNEVAENRLVFNLPRAICKLSCGLYKPDDQTGLIFYEITRFN